MKWRGNKTKLTGLWLPDIFVCKMVSLATKLYLRGFVMPEWVKTKQKNKILPSCCPLLPKKTNTAKEASCRTDFSVGSLLRQG